MEDVGITGLIVEYTYSMVLGSLLQEGALARNSIAGPPLDDGGLRLLPDGRL